MRLFAAILASLILLGVPQPVPAQRPAKLHRVGILVFAEPVSPEGPAVRSVMRGLQQLGYRKGTNLEIIVRSAENRAERLPALVAELLAQKPDVLVAGSTPGALAAKKATGTVPIVFAGVIDPVGSGIVPALTRQGGNITGVTVGVNEGFTAKCLELLKETAPAASRVAVIVNPGHALTPQLRTEAQAVEKRLKLRFDFHEASSADQLDRSLEAIGRGQAQAIFIAPDPFLTASSARIAGFATEKRLPSLHYSDRFAEAGGLVSYGASLDESYFKAAAHVDRILKGAKPADIPVEQPTRFQLVLNLKTARAIGFKLPPSIVSRADRTID
jgi:putative tryptophan/tyrosine transport system substrate-binding protein